MGRFNSACEHSHAGLWCCQKRSDQLGHCDPLMTWSLHVTSGTFARDLGIYKTNAGQESKQRTPDDYGFQESFAPSSEL